MELKTYVLLNVSADDYYAKRYPKWSPRAKANVCCPWHEDSSPSLSLSLHNGGAKCHAASCGKTLGNIVHFEAERNNISELDAAKQIYHEFVRPVIPESEIATLQSVLAKSSSFRRWIAEDCGFDATVIKSFGLGLEENSKRITIPIRNQWGMVVNLRRYRIPRFRKSKQDENTKVINVEGHGKLDLFPYDKFVDYSLDKPIFIMASEKETMLAVAGGLQAICSTNGEGSWDEDWTQLLMGYDICIVGQTDQAGVDASAKRFATLQSVCNSIVNLKLPTKFKDFADWIVREGGNTSKLIALYKEQLAECHSPIGEVAQPKQKARAKSQPQFLSDANATSPSLPPYYSEELTELASICSKPEMLNKRVKVQGIVAAKATYNYTVPWKFSVKAKNNPPKIVCVPVGRELAGFINNGDVGIKDIVREIVKDESVIVEPLEYINVTEVEIIPIVSMDCDSPYVVQRCLHVGNWIESNIPYELDIIPVNEIRSQKTIGLITKVTTIALSFENREFSEEELATLQKFQPGEDQSVFDKMLEIADILSDGYTKIFNRPDWHLVALLTWVSPIGWKFPHESRIQRGWLNVLALGDTETGKSRVVETLQRITNCGQIINSENCTYVGLVGGAIKMGSGQLMLRWGRIPLCDKQLVVLEELSGLSVEEISNMSDVRSSGVARLDKGGLSSQTNARTRIIALSNVRPANKTLASYTSGVKAVQELIGHGEDIARFDTVITLVDSDVSVETINQPFKAKRRKLPILESDFQKLVQFAWALKPTQVKFSTEAYYSCLEHTQSLSSVYHPAVPLFKGGSGRYKIARIAAAIATLQFAWDGTSIVVNEDHVEAAVELMKKIYNKYPLCYDEWSKQVFDREQVKHEEALDDDLKSRFKSAGKLSDIIESLIHQTKFTRDELCAVASLQISQADDLIGVWVRGRILRKGDANVWEITPDGKRWLEKFV